MVKKELKRNVRILLILLTAFSVTPNISYGEGEIAKKDNKNNITINDNDSSAIEENSNGNILIGSSNKVKNANQNILVGDNNEIEKGWNSLIIGENNKVPYKGKYNDNNSVVIFGKNNEVIDSQFSTVQGIQNKLDDSHGSLVNGIGNKVIKSHRSLILGQDNEINESGNSYVNGYKNKVSEDSFYTNVTGDENNVKKGQNAFVNGNSNKIEYSLFSSIIGENNSIIGDGVNKNNSVKNSNNHIQGSFNNITKSNNSYIQGLASNITNASNSSIIGGYFSSVNINNSLALGAFSATKEIKNKGYLTEQDTKGVYALAVGGEYKYNDRNGKEHIIKAKRRIQGLADGAEDDEAVTVAQLKKLESKIGGVKVDEALNKSNLALGGVANAVAIANLVQVNSYSKYRYNLSAAYGYYGGSHALAIGFSGTNEKRNFIYKLSGAVNNRGNLALGIGAGIMVGNVDNNNSSKDRVKELETIVKKQDEKLKDQDKKMKLLEQKLEELSKKIR